MKRNYLLNLNTIKQSALVIGITGFVFMALSFGPTFMGPGLSIVDVESFDIEVNTNFPVSGVGAPAFAPAFPNLQFDSPITFNPVPNDNKIVVGQLNGEIYWIDDNNNAAQENLIVNWSAEIGDRNEGAVWDGGFLGLAIHPDFGVDNTKNFFFVYYTTNAANNALGNSQGFSCGKEDFSGNYLLLERFEVDPATMLLVPGSREIMIRRELYNTTHRGGGMTFGPDNYLYLTTGDQASYSPAQDIANNLDGGVLRLDVDMIGGTVSHPPKRFLQDPGVGNTNTGTPGFLASEGLETSGEFYFIPNDNPFNVPLTDVTSPVFEEYYTIGHRSPHRLTMDTATGDLYIGEVGESTHEEINVLRNVPETAGNNYGWPLWEGNAPHTRNCGLTQLYNNAPHEGPLTDFVRDQAGSIIGGYVYNGSIAQYQGRYIAADYLTNQLFAINTQGGSKESLGVGPGQVISFGQDTSGELYMLTLGAGGDSGIFRLTESSTLPAPALLSDTGVFNTGALNDFSDIQELSTTSGFVPYEMIESFWSDGALKRRWIGVPNDGTHNTPAEQVEWTENGIWNFPDGSVIIKHFDFPIDEAATPTTRKIETRFSIKADNGEFYFLTYKWRADESDAELVDMRIGDTATINVTRGGVPDTVDWLYPSNAQCIQCHSPALGGTLGLRTRNLNSNYDYSTHDPDGEVGNQLVTLSEMGILNVNITDSDTPGYLTHIAIDDLNGSTDEKARSYLDNNCAYCHQPATGNGSEIDLRLINTLAQTAMLTATGNNIPGEPTINRIVVPGDAANSQLYHRANSLTAGVKMPPVSKGIVDAEGVALLQLWINGLQEPADVPALGTYRLVNFETKGTLGVADGENQLGANAVEQGYQGLDYQHWVLENASTTNFYRFTPVFSARYLDVNGRPADADFQENVWIWNNDPNTFAQQWEIIPDDIIDGIQTYFIISRVNGDYLTLESNGNVAVLTYDLNNINRFRWQFETPSATPLTFGLELSKTVVVTNEGGLADNFNVSLSDAPASDVVIDITQTGEVDEFVVAPATLIFTATNWATPQVVTVTGQDDADDDCVQYFGIGVVVNSALSDANYAGFSKSLEGYNEDDEGSLACPPTSGIYRLVNVGNNQSMEVAAAGLAWRDNIETGLYEGASHEQFELIFRGDGLYALVAQNSGLAIDVQGGVTTPNTNVWQYDYAENTNNLAQLWRIVGDGTGQFSIISERGGHYLGVSTGTNNVYVNINDGSDRYKWRFEDISQLSNAGVNITPELVYTDEDGDTDSFDVVLSSAPTGDVNIGINVLMNADEINLDITQLVFTTTNWDTPQTVTVTGLDDLDADGVQEFEIEAVVVAPFNDATYIAGVGTTISGFNYDNDGGDNGAPRPGIYQLRNSGNGENLMPIAGANVWQTNMVTGEYLNEEYQHFELVAAINGLYRLKLVVPDPTRGDLYLDKQGGPSNPNTNIWSYPSLSPDPNFAQLWDIVEAGDGSYYIISAIANANFTNNTYLRAEDASGTEGNVSIATDDTTDFFKWQFLGTGFAPVAISSADVLTGNEDLTVQFSSAGSTDDKNDIVSYLWDFGNGDTSNEANPEYTFEDGGSYNVILTIEDGDGYTDVADTIIIDVNGAPVAVASSDLNGGEATIDISFTGDLSTDDVGIASYLWTFEPGETSAVANPVYTFTTVGVYNVTLTVTDAGGLEDTTTLEITITAPNQAPVAVASSNVTGGIVPLEVEFTGDQSTDDVGVETYLWTFEPGETSADANPTYTFNDIGVYTVELTVTDIEGLESTTTIDITVTADNQAPVAVASSNVITGDAPLEVQFTGNQSTDDVGVVSYLWTFELGETSIEANPTYIFATEGTYTVTMVVTDAGGLEDATTVEIIVNADQTPVAVASASVTQGDAPLEVQFTGDQSAGVNDIVSYAWDFGNGDTSTEANPTYTYNTPGMFIATLIVTDSEGLTGTSTIEITVNGVVGDNPTAVASADVTSGDAPLDVQFTGDQSTGVNDIVSYAWNFGNGVTSTEANPTYTYNTPGTYNATLIVTDSEGLTGTSTIEITVGGVAVDNPTAVASADITSGEAPLVVSFIGDQSTGVNDIVSYAWDFGDGETSTDANPTYVYNTPGTFVATLIVTDSEGLTGTSTVEITVTGGVNLAPIAVISSSVEIGEALVEIIFTGDQSSDDTEIVSYAWNFGDGSTSDEVNPVHTFAEPGTYTITLIVIDNGDLVGETSIALQVLDEKTVLENDDFEVVLSPNPSVDFVEVSFSGDFNMDDVIGLMIHDMSGRLIRRYMPEEIADDNKFRISTAIFNNEVYVITLVMNSQEPISKRLVINK
ncbi:PKD repeat protein [Maribacter spongiicola]|uniref:PKD repeat protein n=1 Tax=Maribacter spongiicola TaxID=1206753 RepID=A0A4V3ERF4_9FLAO|nr:PKD domain-containing protein [Maribacter spongiicola]TDT44738.1 PKD repeat protein [Maribacter spongiicola]